MKNEQQQQQQQKIIRIELFISFINLIGFPIIQRKHIMRAFGNAIQSIINFNTNRIKTEKEKSNKKIILTKTIKSYVKRKKERTSETKR